MGIEYREPRMIRNPKTGQTKQSQGGYKLLVKLTQKLRKLRPLK
jgi:nucleoid DNA-binding protein